ncbi:MAG: tetratricopeptide repeat protein [Acidobacteriota bacterium]
MTRCARFVPALVCLVLGCVWAPAATAQSELGGLELTAPVRQQLYRVQDAWQRWTRAHVQGDEAAASAELEQIELITAHLGMERQPDLASAAAAYGLRAADAGDFERAEAALEAARRLDEGRPETFFAASSIARAQGQYGTAISELARGYLALLEAPRSRDLWLDNLALWVLFSLLLAGGLFAGLLMATKGGSLFYDLARLYSPPLGRAAADALTVALLIWPILLPSGVLWLVLWWSVLLWGYGSTSERAVLILCWLALGATPALLAHQQRSVQLALVPPARLIDHLAADRLYGAVFSDLEVLRSLLPESPIVTELSADLHRRLGQWDHARAIYTELTQRPDRPARDTATAYTNLGVYHHRNGEYETAVAYFSRAADADAGLAEAHYGLAQAYAQLYEFESSHSAMAQAKALAPDRVDRWNAVGDSTEGSAVAVDGGLRRVGELRQALAELWRQPTALASPLDFWRRFRALSLSLGLILLAVAIHLVRRQVGYRTSYFEVSAAERVESRWVKALVPGLASAQREYGGLAFGGILLPVALAMAAVMRSMGFRQPVAFDPGPWPAVTLCLVGLVFVLLTRLAVASAETS